MKYITRNEIFFILFSLMYAEPLQAGKKTVFWSVPKALLPWEACASPEQVLYFGKQYNL